MKRILLAILFAIVCVSCSTSKVQPEPDPADLFVGEYTVTDNYFLLWGNSSGSSSLTSKFMLTKIAPNRVKMIGEWTTTGTVTSNTIQLDPCPYSDSEGFVNYTFGVGTLYYDNTLRFSYTGTGSMNYNGRPYPWNVSGNVIATKITE